MRTLPAIRRKAIPLIFGVTAVATAAAWGGVSAASSSDDGSAEAFSECMRANGVADFPDVTISSDGRVNLDYSDAGIDPFDDTYQAALDTCEEQLPSGSYLPDTPASPSAPATDDACLPPTAPPEPSLP